MPKFGIALAVQQSLLDRVCLDSLQRLHAGIFRVRAAPHLLDNQERTQVVKIRFATPG